MTVAKKSPRTLRGAIRVLKELAAEGDCVFRGHGSAGDQLKTTLERYWVSPVDAALAVHPVEKFISLYQAGLTRMGGTTIGEGPSWLDWLEHARHHGAPAPLLDFSWSPYVALFFAFNGVRGEGRSVVYALSVKRLKRFWALRRSPDRGPGFRDVCRDFERIDGLEPNELRFVRCPGRFAQRMHRQLGAFLYCTLDYRAVGVENFEGYLEQIDETADAKESPIILSSEGPVLTKVVLRHDWATEAFEMLELMNIRGATLFQSADGVACDVWNAFHYNPRSTYLREPC